MENAPDAVAWHRQELNELFAPLTGAAKAALAVSGGPDSTALLHLFALWRSAAADSLPGIVLTVDHGLRPEAAEEAEFVADLARSLGLPHRTLCWHGPKPASGIQAAARAARYALLQSAAAAEGADVLMTAHTLDDQAETFLLALARGSGVYGLAAMPAERRLGTLRLIRPLLAIPKARLIATLRSAGIAWRDDPSNANSHYARVAVRKAAPEFARHGLDSATLAATAERLARAASALDTYAGRLIAETVAIHPGGFLRFDIARFLEPPDEVVLRALSLVLRALMGHDYGPRFDRLERLHADVGAALRLDRPLQRTLADAVLRLSARPAPSVWLYPEAGRSGFPELILAPGESRLWQDRIRLSLSPNVDRPTAVRALGPAGRRLIAGLIPHGLPSAAAETVASAWHGETLVGVPAFGYAAPPLAPGEFGAEPLVATRLGLAVAPAAEFAVDFRPRD
ncbi:MAG: tRNA lysidine(34) synthetase TilS [Ancalomicrobiaceae bacterium]|nr:tRNA lysidine(34) synthetase TilS [Ancalomicrobiaceae bacterium]